MGDRVIRESCGGAKRGWTKERVDKRGAEERGDGKERRNRASISRKDEERSTEGDAMRARTDDAG